jgi:hypothetical protein
MVGGHHSFFPSGGEKNLKENRGRQLFVRLLPPFLTAKVDMFPQSKRQRMLYPEYGTRGIVEWNRPDLPAHIRLCDDVLELAFDFLTFEELHQCTQVSKDWITIAYNMQGLAAGKSVRAVDNAKCLFSSRLARHVSSLEHACKSIDFLPHQQLACIVSAFPFLRELHLKLGWEHMHIDSRYDWNTRLRDLQLPCTLRSVTLHFARCAA